MGEEHEQWMAIFNDLMDKRDEWKYDNPYSYQDWAEDIEIGYPEPNDIIFNAGTNDEMLKITQDGFYVRGVRVEQGPGEAEAVYKAFKEFMTWAVISRPAEEDTK